MKITIVRYLYIFGDGAVKEFVAPLPFNLLKACVDCHHGLIACKKIVKEEGYNE